MRFMKAVKKGQIGCMECKRKIAQSINDLLEPMRERRVEYQNNSRRVDEILVSGTEKARLVAKETMQEIREAMGMNYFTNQ